MTMMSFKAHFLLSANRYTQIWVNLANELSVELFQKKFSGAHRTGNRFKYLREDFKNLNHQ